MGVLLHESSDLFIGKHSSLNALKKRWNNDAFEALFFPTRSADLKLLNGWHFVLEVKIVKNNNVVVNGYHIAYLNY